MRACAARARELYGGAAVRPVASPGKANFDGHRARGEFRLANSGLEVAYSSRYYRFAAGGDTAVVPDKLIAPTWEQFRSGRDPVLDWILAQPIR